MRFTASVFAAALVGLAAASPILPVVSDAPVPATSNLPVVSDVPAVSNLTNVTNLVGNNDLVSELTGVVAQVESGRLGADKLEAKLQVLLGSAVPKVESALGQPLADKLLAQIQAGQPHQIVQAVGQAVLLVQQGVDMKTVDSYVKGATDGKVASLEKAMGVANVDKILRA